jgi:16S rRNA (guanine527-N7)-methyltransferase
LSENAPEPPPLEGSAREAIAAIAELIATDPLAPTSIRDRARIRDVHIADSLSARSLPELERSERVCDIGSGAGLPGLVLAAALPATRFVLLDSAARKCEFIERAAAAAGLTNVTVVAERAEAFALEEPGAFDVVPARAVGRLSTLAELAAPLLHDGGALIAYEGRRDREQEAELERASAQLAMSPERIVPIRPYAGSENRHLHLIRKSGPTPAGLPRRPGLAKKRPLGRR